MDVFQRKVFIVVLLKFMSEVWCCDIPESERFECGFNITNREQCEAINCCYDDSKTPKCYFPTKVREKVICSKWSYIECRRLRKPDLYIHVVDVIYGRVVGLNGANSKCGIEPKVNCTAPAYCEVAERSNRRSASAWLYPNDLKQDPCPGQNKSLIIKYKCLDRKDTLLGLVGDNFALNKSASQSSQNALGGTPSKAVDGDTRNIDYIYCTRTAKQTNPWWRVDLEQHIAVSHARIFNTKDRGIRLCGFEIRIGDSTENNGTTNARCGALRHIPSNKDDVISCEPPLVGRYVTIVIPGDDSILSLCEVQVYGTPVLAVTTQPPAAMKPDQPRTKSTTGAVYVATTSSSKKTSKVVWTQPSGTTKSSEQETRGTENENNGESGVATKSETSCEAKTVLYAIIISISLIINAVLVVVVIYVCWRRPKLMQPSVKETVVNVENKSFGDGIYEEVEDPDADSNLANIDSTAYQALDFSKREQDTYQSLLKPTF